jgi:hypothetical protein
MYSIAGFRELVLWQVPEAPLDFYPLHYLFIKSSGSASLLFYIAFQLSLVAIPLIKNALLKMIPASLSTTFLLLFASTAYAPAQPGAVMELLHPF